MEKYYYSWSQLRKDVVKLAKKLKQYRFSAKGGPARLAGSASWRRKRASGWDYMVVIARGGMIPASLLSYYLKIKKIRVVSYSHYKADAIQKKLSLILPLDSQIRGKKVLLVDDVVDTGETMAEAWRTLVRRKNKVTTVVLHYKKCLEPIFKPDYYASDPGNIWVVYPWEI